MFRFVESLSNCFSDFIKLIVILHKLQAGNSKQSILIKSYFFKMSYFVAIWLVLTAFTLNTSSQNPSEIPSKQSESNGSGNRHPSAVYPLPEMHIKLENGTTLQSEPNSPVVLSQQLNSVELSCTADYPVKWEYLVNNKSIPLMDVVYRRLIRNISAEFLNPKRNRFMSLVKLRGLLESQSGKYLCRHYNEKLNNNSYSVSSFFDVFIPGNNTFNAISSVKFMNKTAAHVSIPCPVTNPSLHVRLYKLNEKHFMKTRQLSWKPIYANYEPTAGFRLLSGLGRELLGTYNCTADNGASVVVDVADLSEKELYLSSTPASSILNGSCWEDVKLIRYLRSQRLECFCEDSYGLFVNGDDYEFENRQARCSMKEVSDKLDKCNDWRLNEYFQKSPESRDMCFWESIPLSLGDDKSGSRPSLTVNGKTFPEGDGHRNFPFSKLNVTYNGFVDWAGDFMLAICRAEVCHAEFNEDGTSRRSSSNHSMNLEYLGNEPIQTQYFPMAHYQAKWNDVLINGTDVKRVYVFQAHSLSYAWFPYATTQIEWDGQSLSSTLPEGGQKIPFDSEKMMSESTSSTGASAFYEINKAQSNYGFCLFSAILLTLNIF